MKKFFIAVFILVVIAVTFVNVTMAYSYIDGIGIATFYFLCAEFIFAVGLSVIFKVLMDKWEERKDKKLFAESI